MATRLEPCVPLDFDETTRDEVINKAKDWALMHGTQRYFQYLHKN